MSFRLVVCFYLLTVTLTHSRFYKRPRIIGGHDAVPGEVPHQVSLQLGFLPKYPYKHFCGGSILNEYWILTASHCLEDVRDIFKNSTDTLPKVFKIKAGKYNIREVEDTEQIRNVEAYFMHEDFNGTFNGVISYDIALLRLQEPLKLNQNVTAIKLSQSTGEELSGEVKISGWGELGVKDKYPAILQIETVPVWERLKCLTELEKFAEEQQRQKEKEQEENNDAETDDEDKKKEKEKETEDKQKKKGKPVKLIFLAQEDTLCSGPLTTGVSVCSGDSGGPMTMIDKNGEPELVGISAWAISPCGSKGAPAGYTKVSYYLDWIKKTMVDNPKIIVENNWNNSSSLNPNITDINTTTEKNMDADDKTNSSIYLTTENPKIINLENNSINALVYF